MATNDPSLHIQILSTAPASQVQSPLLRLPGEIRSQIFALALADHPEPLADRQYDAKTCYRRPAYFAPRKSDVRLLRTCRAIYRETWFMPFILREQTHWLGTEDRAPPEYVAYNRKRALKKVLGQICQQQGNEEVEIESLRVFSQMWALEDGGLSQLLRTPHLRPRMLTLTIRHTDWWFWENEEPLRMEGTWIRNAGLNMPSSVAVVRIELESLEQKKGHVDHIAKNMTERWFFKRMDGVVLYPDASGKGIETDRWTGSSTWHSQTWTRDEARPGEIDYYIASVVFRPAHVVERLGGRVSNRAANAAKDDIFDCSQLRLHLWTYDLESENSQAGNNRGSDAEEDEWEEYDQEGDDDEEESDKEESEEEESEEEENDEEETLF